MFSRWGAFVHRFRRPVAILAVVLAVASMALASRTADSLGRLADRLGFSHVEGDEVPAAAKPAASATAAG